MTKYAHQIRMDGTSALKESGEKEQQCSTAAANR